jgi:DNA-binding transcriptional ArsR family regulator
MKPNKAARQEARKIFEMQCRICKAMAHPLRLEIVHLLNARSMPASELIAALEVSKASVSKHMNQLVQAGIVEASRIGRQVHYRLAQPEIYKACTIMRSILYRQLKEAEKLASALRLPKAV